MITEKKVAVVIVSCVCIYIYFFAIPYIELLTDPFFNL